MHFIKKEWGMKEQGASRLCCVLRRLTRDGGETTATQGPSHYATCNYSCSTDVEVAYLKIEGAPAFQSRYIVARRDQARFLSAQGYESFAHFFTESNYHDTSDWNFLHSDDYC